MAFLPGNLRLRVKELRTQHNMTQEELASILGVDKGTVSRLEKEPEKGEEKSPKVSCDLLIKLAEYFHVSADFLLGITNVSDPVNQPGASSDTELFKNHRSTIRFQGHRIATCLYRTPMGSRV